MMEPGDRNKDEKEVINPSSSDDTSTKILDEEKIEDGLSSETNSVDINEDSHNVPKTSGLDSEIPEISQTKEVILAEEKKKGLESESLDIDTSSQTETALNSENSEKGEQEGLVAKESGSDTENLKEMEQTTEESLLVKESCSDIENSKEVEQTPEEGLVARASGSGSENSNKIEKTTEEDFAAKESGPNSENPYKVEQIAEEGIVAKEIGLDSVNSKKVEQSTEESLVAKESSLNSENSNKLEKTTEEGLVAKESGLDSENSNKVEQTIEEGFVTKESSSDTQNLNKVEQATDKSLVGEESGSGSKISCKVEPIMVEGLVAKESGLDCDSPVLISQSCQTAEEGLAEEKQVDPVFDGTEVPDSNPEAQTSALVEKAAAFKNFVKVKGAVAVSTVLRRLSGGKDDDSVTRGEQKKDTSSARDISQEEDSSTENKLTEVQQKVEEPAMKGSIIVYTRLGCQECKEIRSFMHQKKLKFVEINVDIYPGRKLELEKNTGSSAVPKVYFNDSLVGGLSELKASDESGKLDEMIKDLMTKEPSPAAPLPPLPGEDDVSGSGKEDEFASIVRKMKETIVLISRFYKMRRFNNCFLGSEAVDFLSEDQYLEREEAVELGRKLASKHFFRHVLDENIFEDGNHLYRYLEHDPLVLTQCYNMTRGLIEFAPKPIIEIASRLRFVSFAIFEAHVSEDGRHVDYQSIQACEEFRRYLRIIEELQRVDLDNISREEKLAFFINLYNMMAIHGILTWGYPVGALDRRKFLGDFKYVVGGCTYSLSAIQNGVLRGNQRPPYNITKPFGPRDKRFKVALSYPEPLVHFALVCGTRSGPALRCYSPRNIDKELVEAAEDFIRNGGLIVDTEAKVASISKILRWYSVDFGKNEVEVAKHAANYLEPAKSEEVLELLSNSQLKLTYQQYDWGANS